MAALFQVVLFALAFVQQRWGTGALHLTSAAIGLTDLDALTLSIACGTPALAPQAAAAALMVGIISNTLLKASVAVVVGKGRFRWMVGGALAAMIVAIAWRL